MPRLIWKNILYNITDAREQLEELERRIKSEKKPDNIEFQIMLEHAYHHLNFAWNTRHIPAKIRNEMTQEDFNEWSKFPKGIEICRIPTDEDD